jgi:hypothetical protein
VPERFTRPGAEEGADEKLAHDFEAGKIEPDEGVGFEAAEVSVEGPAIGTRGVDDLCLADG